MLVLEIQYQAIKSTSKVLNIYSKPDTWFWVAASINPYRGCEHNCAYCDGKAEWYRIKNFGTHIKVKVDAAQKYEKELIQQGLNPEYRPKSDTLEAYLPRLDQNDLIKVEKSPRFPVAVGGGVCDVYQPAEKRFKVTRQLLTKNRDFGIPTIVLTKSSLVLRDLDLISEINKIIYSSVSFSITLIDEELKKFFEPRSASTAQRFNALEIVRKKKLHGGVMFMPVLPGIGDTEDNMKTIIKKAKEKKAEFIILGGLTLKPGRSKQEYLSVIEQQFPRLLPLYQDVYGNNNKYGSPDPRSKTALNPCKIGHEYCRKFGIPDRMPRFIPDDVPQTNFLVSTILHNLAYYYQWVCERNWRVVTPFTKAAEAIESLSNDISQMKRGTLQSRLKLTDEVVSVVLEILETGKSTNLMEYQEPSTIMVNQ